MVWDCKQLFQRDQQAVKGLEMHQRVYVVSPQEKQLVKDEQKKPHYLTSYAQRDLVMIAKCLKNIDHIEQKGMCHEIKIKPFKATKIFTIQLSKKKISQVDG